MKQIKDNFNRVHDYLRISLTDKCNLNCLYCNPLAKKRTLLAKNSLLSNKEILRIIEIFLNQFGFQKIRFTGGEPLVRSDILDLLKQVHQLKRSYNFQVGLTTNGTLLEKNLAKLKEYGIDKLNISLDSLNRDKFKFITGRDNIKNVLRAIAKAKSLNFPSLKINVVIIKNLNDDEITDFVNFVIGYDVNVRFIEFMPFGNNSWNRNGFIGFDEMLQKVKTKFQIKEILSDSNSVAKDFHLLNKKGIISFISPISHHFCDNCNRLRITAGGQMKLCLFTTGQDDLNLKQLLSSGNLSDGQIGEIIETSLKNKALAHPGVEELLNLEKNNMLNIGG